MGSIQLICFYQRICHPGSHIHIRRLPPHNNLILPVPVQITHGSIINIIIPCLILFYRNRKVLPMKHKRLRYLLFLFLTVSHRNQGVGRRFLFRISPIQIICYTGNRLLIQQHTILIDSETCILLIRTQETPA